MPGGAIAVPRSDAVDTGGVQLLIARNPGDPDSRLPYLLRVPLGAGLVFRTAGTWPRTNALYCHPVPDSEWPAEPEIVEQVPVRSCVRRGAAIDLVLDRARENRSQLVFTTARGREAVFWQSARTPQTGPAERADTDRAGGRHRRVGDRGQLARAVPVPVHRPAGPHHAASAAVRGLRADRRRAARRGSRTQIDGGPGGQPDQRQAALRAGRPGRATPRRAGGRGPLLPELHPEAGSPRTGRGRTGGVAGALAERADRVRRDPPRWRKNGPTATSLPRTPGPMARTPR